MPVNIFNFDIATIEINFEFQYTNSSAFGFLALKLQDVNAKHYEKEKGNDVVLTVLYSKNQS